MKARFLLALVGLCSMSFLPAVGAPQNETKDKDASLRTLTGCLSKGDSAGEYKLTTPEGNTWDCRFSCPTHTEERVYENEIDTGNDSSLRNFIYARNWSAAE